MGQSATILIVDSNPGFALMLKESLEEEGGYLATVALTGSEALDAASTRSFELAIVDLGIQVQDGLDGEAVARKLRAADADLSLILIPLQGDELPKDLNDLGVQGTLPKPFFLPDLPNLVEAALGGPLRRPGAQAEPETQPGPGTHAWPGVPERSPPADKGGHSAQSELPEQPGVREASERADRPAVRARGRAPDRVSGSAKQESPAQPPVAESADVPELHRDRGDPQPSKGRHAGRTRDEAPSPGAKGWCEAATAEVERLAGEVNADAVMVTDRGDVVVCVGGIRGDRRDALGQTIWRACRLARMATRSLGSEPTGFEQAVEGEDYVLYTSTIEDNVLLSVVLRSDTTLGFLRHRVRETARRLRAALSVPEGDGR